MKVSVGRFGSRVVRKSMLPICLGSCFCSNGMRLAVWAVPLHLINVGGFKFVPAWFLRFDVFVTMSLERWLQVFVRGSKFRIGPVP